MKFLIPNSWRFLIIVLVGCSICCSHIGYLERGSKHQACRLLDSMYANAFLNPHFTLRGKATFDVEQRRIKGAYELVVCEMHANSLSDGRRDTGTANSRGFSGTDKTFNFVGSTIFGAGREDLSVFLVRGLLRILDRERGEYYEAEEAEEILRENLGLEGDFNEIISITLGDWRPCLDQSIILLRAGKGGRTFSGKNNYGDFHIDLSGPHGKLREITWPFELSDGEVGILRVQYHWSNEGSLESIILSMDRRRWRIKLTVSEILGS